MFVCSQTALRRFKVLITIHSTQQKCANCNVASSACMLSFGSRLLRHRHAQAKRTALSLRWMSHKLHVLSDVAAYIQIYHGIFELVAFILAFFLHHVIMSSNLILLSIQCCLLIWLLDSLIRLAASSLEHRMFFGFWKILMF